MNNQYRIISLLLILLALFSPPFIFSQIQYFGREIRTVLGLLVLCLILVKTLKFNYRDIYIYLLIFFFISIELIIQRSQINNVLSSYAVIIVGFSLFRLLETNPQSLKTFLNFWLCFSYVTAIAAIISFTLHQFTNFNADLLNFSSSQLFNQTYNYKMSIFGFTIMKDFGFFKLARVCSYFTEPQYAGIFFAFNILIGRNYNKLIQIKYISYNILAGLLTFSFTFYIFFLIFIISYLKTSDIKFVIVPLSAIFFMVLYFVNIHSEIINIISASTSYIDRMQRNSFVIDIISQSSILKLLFGHGINNISLFFTEDEGRGISSGALYLQFELGIIVFIFFIALTILFSNRNYLLLFSSIIFLLAMPWFRYYFCWYAIVLCGFKYTEVLINERIIE